MSTFYALSREPVPVKNVRRAVQEWLSEQPISRAIIADLWQKTYETEYASTAANYRAAVRMILPLLDDRRRVAPPMWVRTGGPRAQEFSDYGARLVDGLMFHIGALYGATEFGWALDVDRVSVHYGDPYVLPRRGATPANAAQVLAWIRAGEVPLSRMEFPFNRNTDLLEGLPDDPLRDDEYPPPGVRPGKPARSGLFGRVVSGPVPELPEPIRPWPQIVLSSDTPEPVPSVEELLPGVLPSGMLGCTHELWVDEAAEHVWGAAKFAAFEGELAKQPGIEKVVGEDREIIHVDAPTLSDDEVVAAARRAAQ